MQIKQEQNADGTVTVTKSVTFTATEKTTYPQKWSAYNAAQTNEQDKFLALLADLCSGLSPLPKLAVLVCPSRMRFSTYSKCIRRSRNAVS